MALSCAPASRHNGRMRRAEGGRNEGHERSLPPPHFNTSTNPEKMRSELLVRARKTALHSQDLIVEARENVRRAKELCSELKALMKSVRVRGSKKERFE
jgi:hypothetical protein